MSDSYFLHANDTVTISNGSDTLQMTLDEFVGYEPGYVLDMPYISRYYIPTVKDELHTENAQFGGPVPWTEGDGYIASLMTYINQHNNPPRTLSAAKISKYASIDSMSQFTKGGNVLLFSTTMPSLPLDSNALISYQNLGNTPMGFYLLDISNAQVTLSLTQLNTYNNGIAQLYLLCNQNADALKSAVSALSSVGAVDAYDITTGWPTIPYTPV